MTDNRETHVDRYGMKPQWGFDNTRGFNDLIDDAMESGRRVFHFGLGEYQFFSPPKTIGVRGIELIAASRLATTIGRRFKAERPDVGVFNFDHQAWGAKISGFEVVGREECAGTGSMVSLVTRQAPEGITGFRIEDCRFTSFCPGGAINSYVHLDGSNAGAADTPRVRGFELLYNDFFGHVAGGAAVNLVSVMSGYVVGGFYTPGTDPAGNAYPACVLRLDGGPGEYAQTQSMRIDINRAFTVEFRRAKDVLLDAAYMVELIRRPGQSRQILVRCPQIVGTKTGGWNGEDGCWLRQS